MQGQRRKSLVFFPLFEINDREASTMGETIVVTPEELGKLMKQKLETTGLYSEHAEEVTQHLTLADVSGIRLHGAVRMGYYTERIARGGIMTDPELSLEETGPSTATFHGNNGVGQFVRNEASAAATSLAKGSGVAYVDVSQTNHSRALSCCVKRTTERGMVALLVCQSDPVAVSFDGTNSYFGTSPIAFAAPRADRKPVVSDMTMTVQAWEKISDTRSKGAGIPDTWAVDEEGQPATNPYEIRDLLLVSGSEGYGLVIIIDVSAGSLLGLPFGKYVNSMYTDLTGKRSLDQMFLVIGPSRSTDSRRFRENINQMVEELHCVSTVEGFQQVYYPGGTDQLDYQKAMSEGIKVPQNTYDYLVSETIHYDKYGGQDTFAR